MSLNFSRPELLAPAGDRDCIRAAIENGADAVYFGLDTGFNARARAKNFDVADLPEIMRDLHSRGVRGYVTVNTLVFTSELPEVESLIRQIAAAGADAVLVQDLGLVRLIREICPDLPIHASTQMTLTSSETIAVARELGIERVVLARECSLDEIRRIRAASNVPLEAFVHGALCVAYSGQCLTSESLGGRSANRGQCAQACRLPYDLVCDGAEVDLGDQKYLLSPQDLAAYDLIPDLIEAGVCCFKIEGRLKTPEYVANIVQHYRRAIDAALANRPLDFSLRDVEEMELSFSRGFSHGWLDGCDHKALVPATSSAKRGVLLGRVLGISRGRVRMELVDRAIKRGVGVSFDSGHQTDDDQGGRVYEVFVRGCSVADQVSSGVVELTFAHGAIDFTKLQPGMQVWKNDDPELTSRLRKSFSGALQRRVGIDLEVHAAAGEPLTVHAITATGHTCSVQSDQPCAQAIQHALTTESLQEQLGRLGNTALELRTLTAHIEDRPMLPFSVLGRLRHQLVESLTRVMTAPPPRRIAQSGPLAPRADNPSSIQERAASRDANQTSENSLTILCRSLPQLEEILALGEKSLHVDFQDIREYRKAVMRARESGATIYLATPRIQKQGELGIFYALAKHGADGILVRNLSGLRFFTSRGIPTIADFALNAANELTVDYLLEQGAKRVTPSYDLNRDQLLDLVQAAPAGRLEIVIHQHMPMFHMEHCVFCAVLSPGTNKTNCGRPCDHHHVQLRDRLGVEHPLVADVGCRNTLFNAVPQSGAEIVPQLSARGVRHFRIELLDERGEHLQNTLALYRRLLAGQTTGKEVWSRLQATNRIGITRGTLEDRRPLLAIG